MQVSDIGEFGLISRIESMFRGLIPRGCVGIGDDCAVIPISETQSMVITTDMLVEDIHFLRSKTSAYDLGYKSLAVSLSDLAAMGAVPHSSFLSLAIPNAISTEWCAEFMEGYKSLGVSLLGGDTTKSPDQIVINVTAIGVVGNENIKRRNGARSGDRIYVTSSLGDSAAGLRAILDSTEQLYPGLVRQHFAPRPHLAESVALSSLPGVHSMMDISDGLASDLRHILRASGVGAVVELTSIPLSAELIASPWDGLEMALTGGEDYCLLFTASPDTNFPPELTIYPIGEIIEQPVGEILWIENGVSKDLNYKGFTHF